jgi:hypothetical protein
MNGSLEQVLGHQLRPTEQLLWAGRPREDIFLRPIDTFLIPFSIFWLGFVIFGGMSEINKKDASAFNLLVCISLAAMGLYVLVGRYWVDAWQRRQSVYGVTSERLIVVSGLRNSSALSRNFDSLTELALQEGSGGGGTITFGANPAKRWAAWAGLPGFGEPTLDRFDLAADARGVYEIIRKAQQAAGHLAEK